MDVVAESVKNVERGLKMGIVRAFNGKRIQADKWQSSITVIII